MPEQLERVIEELRREDPGFHVDGGSWTNNISWVRGYDALLGLMDRVSALFLEKVLSPGVPSDEYCFGNALFLFWSRLSPPSLGLGAAAPDSLCSPSLRHCRGWRDPDVQGGVHREALREIGIRQEQRSEADGIGQPAL